MIVVSRISHSFATRAVSNRLLGRSMSRIPGRVLSGWQSSVTSKESGVGWDESTFRDFQMWVNGQYWPPSRISFGLLEHLEKG